MSLTAPPSRPAAGWGARLPRSIERTPLRHLPAKSECDTASSRRRPCCARRCSGRTCAPTPTRASGTWSGSSLLPSRQQRPLHLDLVESLAERIEVGLRVHLLKHARPLVAHHGRQVLERHAGLLQQARVCPPEVVRRQRLDVRPLARQSERAPDV